ncbi:MAG: phospho-N-acetylmuramoyl-pentapeptide-transferase [Nocardioidaceae bacterium]|nr:phospho-N-acetylmuramoyl-pentapeptide-transferase [Nocardioidaceae bacterium]
MRALLLAGAFGLIGTLLGTRWAIAILVKKGYGQLIRDDGPTAHHTKRGTPTMGGLVVIVAVLVAYFAAKLILRDAPSASALLLLALFGGLGAVGFLDDYIKISKQRSLGLRTKAKVAGQTTVAAIFGWASLQFPDERGNTPASSAVSFVRELDWKIPALLIIVWVIIMIAGTSNAVNLADGLDGLAIGSSMMVFGAYTLVGIWQHNQFCQITPGPRCYNEIRDPLDLAVVTAALTGACFGFLWWNAAPAQIFMGDTGSLSLGGAMAGLAIMTRTELLLVIFGGLFAVITLSVILQVGFFKLTNGKRLFRMAPLQHHFELLGWAEVTIVIRFWIICGICVATGLGLFYAEWVLGV